MPTNARRNRQYKTSELPTLSSSLGEELKDRRELLSKLYAEICSSWRMLTDVRFKLLGFVPTISAAILLSLAPANAPREGAGLSIFARSGIAALGLIVTLALYIYERRNSQLYDDLISRGRKIEKELGVDTGHFLGRPTPTHPLIQHDVAINLIYGATLTSWVFTLFGIWLRWL